MADPGRGMCVVPAPGRWGPHLWAWRDPAARPPTHGKQESHLWVPAVLDTSHAGQLTVGIT